MRLLQVGQPFTDWNDWREEDATQYNYMQGQPHELLIMLHSPTTREVDDIWHNDAAFGLYVHSIKQHSPIIFLAYRFGQPVSFEGESPFSIHMVPAEDRKLPDLELAPDEGAACAVILVDATSRLVEGLRILAFTNRFSLALHRAIHQQAKLPFNQDTYDRALSLCYRAYTSRDIWASCAVTCKAGQKDSGPPPAVTTLFPLGAVVATPGALAALDKTGQSAGEFLARHVTGDWGELDPFDVEQNNLAVEGGSRILSAYRLLDDAKLWIITEWDRSVTTLLLPEEY